MSLYITRLEVENIRGIDTATMEPGKITILSGDNGTGKSSWIDAIRAVFDGGYDPKLVRIGEKKATVQMTLSDGTVCARTINAEKKTSTLTVKSADGEVVKSPQSFIEEIADSFAYDPLDLMFADKKTRQKIIQGFLNVTVTVPELRDVIREEWFMEHFDPRKNAFENIEAIHKAGKERRRQVNVQHDEAVKTVNTLRRDMPTANADSQGFEDAAKQARTHLTAVTSAKRQAVTELVEQYEAGKQGIEAWAREEIAKIQAERMRRLAAAEETRLTLKAEIDSEHDPIIEAAARAETEATEALKHYHHAEGLRVHLRQQEERIKELAGQSMRYDAALAELEKLRKQKMEHLPIEGAEMRDGELFIGGIAFDGLNDAQKIMVSIQVAASRAKTLPFMVIDGLERLGSENRESLFSGAEAAGFQIVSAEVVSGKPLTVSTR